MATNYDDICNQVKEAYRQLLIVQYYDKPKAIETIKLHIDMLLMNALPWKIRDLCLNVDESVGVQLDVIGKWVGIDRYISSSKYEGKLWYSYIDWQDETEPNSLQGGLRDWDNEENTDGPFLSYEDIITSQRKLDDDTFRTLIKLKIVKNNTNHTAKNIDDNLFNLFGNKVYIDWSTPLQMVYNYKPSLASIIEIAKDKNCLPCPTGIYCKLQEI